MSKVIDRFLKYVSFDTISDPNSTSTPTTAHQLELAKYLVDEMTELGIQNVQLDEFGYVYGLIPANVESAPKLGFISHMDTAPAMSGKNIKPRIVENYDGKDILLNEEKNIIMRPSEFESLNRCKGLDLIVTDGTTLLGADDKAGIAEIMAMAEYILSHPEIKHGDIKIGFTPDEEVGAGADNFNVKKFDADFAYTVDGGMLGEIEYENFNAAGVKLTVNGKNIHPGSAKGKMINSLELCMEFYSMLPTFDKPQYTEGYEGFNHLDEMSGNVEQAHMEFIIRDHDMDKFEAKKQLFKDITAFLNKKYGENTFELDMSDSYFNMKEQILPHMHLIDSAKKAMKDLDIEPLVIPIRGGTDGARLSFMGLPCPNLCTGGENFHGRFEYIPVQSMEKMVDVLLNIVNIYSEK